MLFIPGLYSISLSKTYFPDEEEKEEMVSPPVKKTKYLKHHPTHISIYASNEDFSANDTEEINYEDFSSHSRQATITGPSEKKVVNSPPPQLSQNQKERALDLKKKLLTSHPELSSNSLPQDIVLLKEISSV